jgi:[acyl-carrier-protein] S-malonyltransferase
MKAFVFPGQGAQFVGMGKDLYENFPLAKELFEKANDILGYRITDIMFEGTDEDLRQTKVTQPAVFLHSVISALCMGDAFQPEMTAGHSLGEFSALVAAGALSFEDGLKLVYARAMAMQKACEAQPSTMAAIIALPDEKVEEICASVSAEGEVCVAANYNCPGQIVISGSIEGINKACELMKAACAISPVYQMCVAPNFFISCKACLVKSFIFPHPFSSRLPFGRQVLFWLPNKRVKTWYMIIFSVVSIMLE